MKKTHSEHFKIYFSRIALLLCSMSYEFWRWAYNVLPERKHRSKQRQQHQKFEWWLLRTGIVCNGFRGNNSNSDKWEIHGTCMRDQQQQESSIQKLQKCSIKQEHNNLQSPGKHIFEFMNGFRHNDLFTFSIIKCVTR